MGGFEQNYDDLAHEKWGDCHETNSNKRFYGIHFDGPASTYGILPEH